MRKIDFGRIRKIENYDEIIDSDLQVGDAFLYGKSMTTQLEEKKAGQEVSYYIVTAVRGKKVMYKPVFDKLED